MKNRRHVHRVPHFFSLLSSENPWNSVKKFRRGNKDISLESKSDLHHDLLREYYQESKVIIESREYGESLIKSN